MTEKKGWNKLGGMVVALLLFCGNAFGVGDTPISGLRLTSSADGGWYNFTNLNSVVSSNMVSTNATFGAITLGGVTLTNWPTSAIWGSITGSLNNQTDLWSYVTSAVYRSSNNTYSAGTVQALALATVTNNATASIDVVNWQTMTNAIKTLASVPVGVAFLAGTNIFTGPSNVFTASFIQGDSSAIGLKAFAQGHEVAANGSYSHAEGYQTVASNSYSHAEGFRTWATNLGAHSEGKFSQAAGQFSHAEGYSTMATGFASHAEGYSTITYGRYSHAGGANSVAEHDYSYIWSGDSVNTYTSAAPSSFNVNAPGGIYFNGTLVSSNGVLYAVSNATAGAMAVNWQTMTNAIKTLAPTPTLQSVLNSGNVASNSIYLANVGTGDASVNIGTNSGSYAKLYVKGVGGLMTTNPLVWIEGSVGRSNDYLRITGNSGSVTNFRITTNWDVIIKGVAIDSVDTNTVSLGFSTAVTNLFSQSMRRNTYKTFGRLHVANTNNLPFDQIATLCLYSTSNRCGTCMRFLTTNRVFATYNTNLVVIGTNGVMVGDVSGFSVNQLVFISGETNNEYMRIDSIAETTLNFTSTNFYSHGVSNVVSTVMEYITPMYDETGNSNLWGMVRFPAAQTVTLSNVVVVTQ